MRNLGPRRRRRTVIAVVVLVVVGAGVIAGFVATYGLDTNTTQRVAAGGTRVVPVTLKDFDVTPGTLVVGRGTRLLLDVVNRGDQVHDLAVAGGPATRMLGPGDSQRLDLGVATQRLQSWCTVESHKSLGMTLQVRVVRPTDDAAGTEAVEPRRARGSAPTQAAGPRPAQGGAWQWLRGNPR
jgi:nitrite reductase (NO-forming)